MEDPRQLILADSSLNDICPVMDADIDFEVGSENSFEVKIRRDRWNKNYTYQNVFYIKNTEMGGVIGEIDTNTELDTTSVLGYTWRGLLGMKVIRPPSGQDYKTVSGELNQVIGALITEQFGDPELTGEENENLRTTYYFGVSYEDTGIKVDNYQFERYCTLLVGIEKMLKSVGYRLKIQYIQREQGQRGIVELSAVPITDYSGEIELSQDSRLNFTFKNIKNGVNHLVCLGKGELQERQVIDLYVQQDGTIGDKMYYSGIDEIAQVYEDTSSEADELKEKGTEKLRELMNGSSFAMDVATLDIDVEIGDIVGGRDYIIGIFAKKPVSKKVYRIEGGEASMEYGIEGED